MVPPHPMRRPGPAAAAPPRDRQAELLDQARVAQELAGADLELEVLDGLSAAGVQKTLFVLESLGPVPDPALAAWVDVLRVKLRRAKLAGKGALFVPEVEAAAPEAEPPAADGP